MGFRTLAWLLVIGASACGGAPGEIPRPLVPVPDDDPARWPVDDDVDYVPELSEPDTIIPSDRVPDDAPTYPSNNNVAIELFDGKLFVAWRTSETHWASPNTVLYIMSSSDMGRTFAFEASFALGSDAREPLLYAIDDQLFFAFFQAGEDTFAFEPRALWRSAYQGPGDWTPLVEWGTPGTVIWDIRRRGGVLYLLSYRGNHYGSGESDIDVFFHTSTDGTTWTPVGDGDGVVYHGGCSEASMELDEDGTLYAVLRNEDGDDTGFGTQICTAPKDDLATWTCRPRSDPERSDSPRLFRHGRDIFLVGRHDIGGPYDQGDDALPLAERRQKYAVDYWNRPKRTALYAIDKAALTMSLVLDFPSAGDTSFPSIRRLSAHQFLIANYTSPPSDPDRTWLEGQGAVDGTQIYLTTLTFRPR